jgi:hypothetical protein
MYFYVVSSRNNIDICNDNGMIVRVVIVVTFVCYGLHCFTF